LPRAHFTQFGAPVESWNVPEVQLVQPLAANPEYLPATHTEQLVAPVRAVNVPAAHAKQLVAIEPVEAM